MSNDKGYYHDKGENDRSNDRYDPPYQGPPVIAEIVNAFRPQDQKDNMDAYDKGWRHTNDQKKR